jgi:hypothetical protein
VVCRLVPINFRSECSGDSRRSGHVNANVAVRQSVRDERPAGRPSIKTLYYPLQ